ncbi:uncharacterized protein LOC130712710 [Lotus japonicus]|uniref:uncharacterized protein LOC130712710 n=1 Tax=Lotus japonicus TaxID=34305 RepID=UPI0025863673|nr:uncharacterized protein LOC130712710 [Lotus japonicus]
MMFTCRLKMPPRQDPSNAQLAQAMSQLAQVVAQQAIATAANNAAQAQREAEVHTRRAQQQARELAQAQTRGLNDFKRQDPPRFSGESDPEKADLWIQELEKIFGVLQTPDDTKLVLATYMLLGDAEYWWRSARQILEASNTVVTWNTFKRAFLDKYFPETAREEKETQFLKLHQGGMSVGEYAAKMEALSKHFRFFQLQVDEPYLCNRFMMGLRYDIEEAVRPLGIRQFQVLVEKAREVEAMKNRRGSRQVSGGPIRSNPQPPRKDDRGRKPFSKKPYQRPLARGHSSGQRYSGVTTNTGAPTPRPEVICFKCHKPGHLANHCDDKAFNCWNCNKPGHLSRDCKEPRAETSRDIDKGKRPMATGRVYALSGQEAAGGKNLIQGTCFIANAPLLVLFDSGATHSFISTDCARKLKLTTTDLSFDLVVSTPGTKSMVTRIACLGCYDLRR